MTALATLALVWLGTERPDARANAALDAWAAGRGLALQAPRDETDDGGEAAGVVAELCDRALDEARDQITAGDDETARRTLARVEQTLREHPELVQAAWLMAERCRLEKQIAERRSEDPARWQARADALEGPRSRAFGDRHPLASSPVEVPVTLVVRGAREHRIYWDGNASGDRFSTTSGEHHLAVARGRHVAWSGWVSVLAAATLDLWVPDTPACSAADFAGVTFVNETSLHVPQGVRCGAWAAAALGGPRGTLRAAVCHLDACEPASTWAYQMFDSTAATSQDARRTGAFPAWATWTLAAVGLAGATTIILWQAGVFDHAQPAQKVVYDGSHL